MARVFPYWIAVEGTFTTSKDELRVYTSGAFINPSMELDGGPEGGCRRHLDALLRPVGEGASRLDKGRGYKPAPGVVGDPVIVEFDRPDGRNGAWDGEEKMSELMHEKK